MTLTRPNDETLVNAQWVPASTGARARAVIIDCVLISILAVLFMGVSILVLNEPKLGLLVAILVVILLVREADLTLTGYSVGGRVAGVRFVDARTGGAPGIGMFFHADLVLVTIVPTLGFGSLLLLSSAAKSPDRRGWHDRISGLMALSTKPGLEDEEEISASSLVSSGTLTEVPEDLYQADGQEPADLGTAPPPPAEAAQPASAEPARAVPEAGLPAVPSPAAQADPAPAFVPADPVPAPAVEGSVPPEPVAAPEAAPADTAPAPAAAAPPPPAATEVEDVEAAKEVAAASATAGSTDAQHPETTEHGLTDTQAPAAPPAPAPAFVPAEPAPVVESGTVTASASETVPPEPVGAGAGEAADTGHELTEVPERSEAGTPGSLEAAAAEAAAGAAAGTDEAVDEPEEADEVLVTAAALETQLTSTEAAEPSVEQHAGPAYHSEVVPPLPEHGQDYGRLQDQDLADSAFASDFVAVPDQDAFSNLDDSPFMVVPGDEAIGAPRSAPSPSESDDHYELVQEVLSRRAAARNATAAASAAATDAVVLPGDQPEPPEPATAPAEEGTKAVNDTLIDASLVDGHTTDEPMIEVPEGESLDSYFAQALIAEDDSLSADSADSAPDEVVSAEGTEGPDPAFVDDRSEPVMRLMPFTNTGRAIHITGPIIIGRAPLNTSRYPEAKLVALGDQAPSVSKTHAAMMPTDHGVLVTDLGSSNGTRVVRAGKARRIPTDVAVMVHEGGVVLLGQTAYRVQR